MCDGSPVLLFRCLLCSTAVALYLNLAATAHLVNIVVIVPAMSYCFDTQGDIYYWILQNSYATSAQGMIDEQNLPMPLRMVTLLQL